jgi:hypothetical protein
MLILRVSGESVAEEHFLCSGFGGVKNDFGYDFKLMFVLEGHNEVENSLELELKFSEFCKEGVIFVLGFGL